MPYVVCIYVGIYTYLYSRACRMWYVFMLAYIHICLPCMPYVVCIYVGIYTYLSAVHAVCIYVGIYTYLYSRACRMWYVFMLAYIHICIAVHAVCGMYLCWHIYIFVRRAFMYQRTHETVYRTDLKGNCHR